MARMNFDELIAKKLQREQDKYAVKEIEVSDGKTLLFKKCGEDTTLAVLDDLSKESGLTEAKNAYIKLMYACCEELHDPKLLAECGVTDCYDIVETIFSVDEILRIGNELMGFLGFSDDKIKNL